VSDGYVCPECGLDYDSIQPGDAAVAIRSFPRRYREALSAARTSAGGDDVVRERPEPATWSALEYTAHVADFFGVFSHIVDRMYAEEKPTLEMPDPDDRAAVANYNAKDPDATLQELDAAAAKLAADVERLDHEAWHRTATFPWGERDILTMVRNAVHEGSHHLRDINRGLAAVGAGR